MSISWSFYSFDIERWKAIFGGGYPGAADAVALSAVWEEVEPAQSDETPSLPEDDDRVILAREIARSGIAYADLDAERAALLDELIVGFFCPEGLQEALAFQPESPEFVHMSVVDALLRKVAGKPLRLLPLLQTGRRYGVDQPPDDNAMYVIFSPAELAELSKEIQAILALPGEWPVRGAQTAAREDLIAVFNKAAAQGRWLAGRYC